MDHILHAIYSMERNIMSQVEQLQAALNTLGTQVDAVVELANTLATDLVELRKSVADSTTANALDAAIAKVQAFTASISDAVAVDKAAETAEQPAATTAQTATSEATQDGTTAATSAGTTAADPAAGTPGATQ